MDGSKRRDSICSGRFEWRQTSLGHESFWPALTGADRPSFPTAPPRRADENSRRVPRALAHNPKRIIRDATDGMARVERPLHNSSSAAGHDLSHRPSSADEVPEPLTSSPTVRSSARCVNTTSVTTLESRDSHRTRARSAYPGAVARLRLILIVTLRPRPRPGYSTTRAMPSRHFSFRSRAASRRVSWAIRSRAVPTSSALLHTSSRPDRIVRVFGWSAPWHSCCSSPGLRTFAGKTSPMALREKHTRRFLRAIRITRAQHLARSRQTPGVSTLPATRHRRI